MKDLLNINIKEPGPALHAEMMNSYSSVNHYIPCSKIPFHDKFYTFIFVLFSMFICSGLMQAHAVVMLEIQYSTGRLADVIACLLLTCMSPWD